MMARLQDLPPEILIAIAELIQNSPHSSFSPTSSYCDQTQPTSPAPSTTSLWACSSLCRILRAVFRPYAWARVNIPHHQNTGSSGGLGRGRVQLSPDQTFLRSLSKFHSLVVAYPEIGGYVRELGVYLPTGGGSESSGSSSSGSGSGGFGAAGFLRWGSTSSSSSSSSSSEAEDQLEESSSEGSEEWEDIFPSLVKRLTRVRKVKVVSYQCHSSGPPQTPPPRSPGFRVDWDILSPSLRTGFETLFALETLSEVELMGVVVPPRMLFGLPPSPHPPPTHPGGNVVYSGPGGSSSNSTTIGSSRRNSTRSKTKLLRNLRNLVLVAHCPMSPKRLEQIDGMGSSSFSTPGFVFSPSSSSSTSSVTSPSSSSSSNLYSVVRNTYPINTIYPAMDADTSGPDSESEITLSPPIRSLTLGYCDSTFLRYITRYYPGAFSSLTRLTLNVIERDLPFCQFFLDQGLASGSASASSTHVSSSSSSSFSTSTSPFPHANHGYSSGSDTTALTRYCPLEEFDLTIRCNTASSFFGHIFDIHSLDFSRCCALPNTLVSDSEAEYDTAGRRRGGGLKKLTLRYLLLSQVTEAVCRAVEGSVGSALGVRLDDDDNNMVPGFGPGGPATNWHHASTAGGGGGGTGVWGAPVTPGPGSTIEELHIVIDWAYNGDTILLEMLGRLDRMVEASSAPLRPQQLYNDSSSLFRHPMTATDLTPSTHRLRKFTFEATHWPCVPPASADGVVGNAGSGRQCALRNLAVGPDQESTSVHAQTTFEGNLDKLFPLVCRASALGQVEFESRYTLEARRDLAGVGCML